MAISRTYSSVAGFALALVFANASAPAQQAPSNRPTFTPDGVVHVPAFDLPPSALISPEAVAAMKARAAMPAVNPFAGGSIDDVRKNMERTVEPMVKIMQQHYSVDMTETTIAGVKARVFTPKEGVRDPHRVLINLHGGAFMMCADGCALLESIPMAAVGRFKVVSVNYREGPENVFPAATEDVVAVYKELLKNYQPQNIGIYGCSAGGVLTGEVEAWLEDKKLPLPGVLGIFGAGATRLGAGDSAYIDAYIDGSFPPPDPNGKSTVPAGYFKGANMDDPLVSPAVSLDVLAKFPPTLVISGTRAPDLSPAIYTHSQLDKAGIKGDLIVGEGMGHCYIYQANLPEARDTYEIMTRFFNENLGHGGSKTRR